MQGPGRESSLGTAFGDLQNGKPVDERFKHYDNLFKAYYNLTPSINDQSMATVLQDCMGLVDVAEAMGSMTVISETVDIALLRQGDVLFRSIGANAAAWSALALRVRSPIIFREAVVHLVGQWRSLDDLARAKLHPDVRDLCQRKHDELDLVKQSIEVRILGHYSGSSQRLPSDNPGRISYANDIYMWMATSLFRHWFSQSICEGRGRSAEDGGATLYRQIAGAASAYLDRKVLDTFHIYFPMSAKGSSCLESHLGMYKEELRGYVGDLLQNRSHMDVQHEPLPYLTCCDVSKADFPWTKPDRNAEGDGWSEDGLSDQMLTAQRDDATDGQGLGDGHEAKTIDCTTDEDLNTTEAL